MANINITEATDYLVSGTTGDDTITLGRALDTDASGPSAIDAFDGNGGSDTLVLTENSLASFLENNGGSYNGEVSYNDTLNGGTWTLDIDVDDSGAGVDTDTSEIIANNGIQSITFSDGVTLTAGVATSGLVVPGTADLDNNDEVNIFDLTTYSWDGEVMTTETFTGTTLVSVDGVAVSGSVFNAPNGIFSLSSGELEFVPTTAAIAEQGNVGETASFSFEVVVADADGEQQTFTISYTAEIPFTTGDDTWNAAEGSADIDETATEEGGNDTFNGDDQVNNITAGDGDDTIFGGNEDDVLEGGAGDDMIRGGNGHDTITVGTGAGAETDSNNLGGGAGDDNITGGDGADVIFGGQGDDKDTANNGNDGGLFGGDGDDTINGGAGDDELNGEDDNDELRGGDGDDILNGGNGNDVLRGGAGEDVVDGGGDNDMIYTSLGGDNLTGGDGDDVFVLKAGTGNTTITDFNAATQTGIDKLNVSELGYTDLNDVLAVAYEIDTASGDAVVIAIDADTTVTLEGVELGDLAAANFDFA